MKNLKNNQAKFSFEKFNNVMDKKQLNTLFGGCTTSSGSTVVGVKGIIGPIDHL